MFTLTVETRNAAFYEQPEEEIARLLRKAADQVEGGDWQRACVDSNGNTVGRFAFDPDE